jgi:CheY-like chemotaxis protein
LKEMRFGVTAMRWDSTNETWEGTMTTQCILVAEDDENARLLLQEALREIEFHGPLTMARDGREAIKYLAGWGEYADHEKYPWPSMVLLDLKMPHVDGFGVLSWWQKESRRRRLPIVVLSASNQKCDIERAAELEAAAFCIKPCSFSGLVLLLQDICGRFLPSATGWKDQAGAPQLLLANEYR